MKVFRSTEEEDHEYIGFKEYLQKLDNSNNPFSCPNLKKLPEDVKLINPNRPSKSYPAGALICMYGIQYGLSGACNVRSDLKEKDGQLEFECGVGIIKFKAQLMLMG